MQFPNWLINHLLAFFSNLLYGLRITDEATGFKLFRVDLLRAFCLECMRFEFCPEVTAKAGLLGVPIIERAIRYHARRMSAGKKIRWTDGVEAFVTLFRWRFGRRARTFRSLTAPVELSRQLHLPCMRQNAISLSKGTIIMNPSRY